MSIPPDEIDVEEPAVAEYKDGKDDIKITQETVTANLELRVKGCEGVELEPGDKCTSKIKRTAGGVATWKLDWEFPVGSKSFSETEEKVGE